MLIPTNVLSGPPSSNGSQINCGPAAEDTEFFIPATARAPAGGFHVPYGPNGPTVIPAGAPIGSVAPGGLTLVGLRPYSSPTCNPFSGVNCPADGIPVFTDIFAEDTIANSNYNAFEAMLEKRFSKGLQFQAAYTFSRSIDQASSFEETLDPFAFDSSRALSLFNSAQRFVISYFWDLPIPKHSGWVGKLVNDWAISGITSFQSGFPIRLSNDSINASSDTELINSFFFVGTEAPQRVAPFTTLNPKTRWRLLVQWHRLCVAAAGSVQHRHAAHDLLRTRAQQHRLCRAQADCDHRKQVFPIPWRDIQHCQSHPIHESGWQSRRRRAVRQDYFGPRPAPGAICVKIVLLARSPGRPSRPGTF